MNQKADLERFRAIRDELVKEWLLGDAQAIAFIRMLMQTVEAWDDLIDRDTEYSADQINEAFLCALHGLPSLAFYRENFAMLQPFILIGINNFHDANKLASHAKENVRNLAFHLRNSLLDLYVICAYIVGGYDHMRKVSADIREFFAFESFQDWDKEAKHA